MAGMELPGHVIRPQIASAVDLIIQQARLKDGSRKTTQLTEIQGMEGQNVILQDLCTRHRGTRALTLRLKAADVCNLQVCAPSLQSDSPKLVLTCPEMSLGMPPRCSAITDRKKTVSSWQTVFSVVYPFNPVVAIPSVNCFCARKYTIMMGNNAIIAPAINNCGSFPSSRRSLYKA
jgi:hypothetical protein